MEAQRRLQDLISVGPAMLRDFEMLGIRSVKELAKQAPNKMYGKLQKLTGRHQDICVLDTFEAAVAQARNSRLAAEKCEWWWWSRERKKSEAKRERVGRFCSCGRSGFVRKSGSFAPALKIKGSGRRNRLGGLCRCRRVRCGQCGKIFRGSA